MATINDIAILCETSTATVSRVLNGDPHVAPGTRERILQVIASAGYKPRTISKKEKKNKQILVLCPTFSNPYLIDILRGIEHKASAEGYETYTCITHRDVTIEMKFINKLVLGETDGIILLNTSLSNTQLNDLSANYPIIQCDAISDGPNISYVSIDDQAAAYDATRYLIKLGNKNIAFLTTWNNIPYEKKRFAGYVAALRDCGIPYSPAYKVICNNNYLDSYNCMEQLMKLPEKPTAIFCFSDLTSLGVMCYAYDHGFVPGRDLDIMGFDGTYLSSSIRPQISVIGQPAYEMGRKAFNVDGINLSIELSPTCAFFNLLNIEYNVRNIIFWN